MSALMTVISPAKTLDFDSPSTTETATEIRFPQESSRLVDLLRACSAADLRGLMSISSQLAELNVQRFSQWQWPMPEGQAKQAVLAFQGDVYTGLDAASLTEAQLARAQEQLRILSGLYGLLRPLDRILPYRLEMGTALASDRGRNLYQWWGDQITERLKQDMADTGANVLINLASNEYFKAIRPAALEAPVVTPEFRDYKNGQYKIISFFAKKARGMMVRYILEQSVDRVEGLKEFTLGGYRFDPERSDERRLCFLRDEANG
ncbi:MAG: peroxide stress protein YaaA [Saccharospirillum sp.]